MKRKLLKVLCAGMILLQAAGCGTATTGETETTQTTETAEKTETQTQEAAGTSAETPEGKTVVHFSELNVDDNVVLGEYKNLEVVKEVQNVTDEEVESYIQYLLSTSSQLVEITDRDVVENGDVANIDYVGKKDGVAFDGGTAQGYDLAIGSGTFIPGFEEGLVGVKKGETVDLDLTFPENYSAADLAGAQVVFTVTVNGIYSRQAQEFTDEFVAGLGIEGVATTDDYRAYAKTMMQESAETTANQNLQGQVMSLATENAEVKEIPQVLIEKFKNVTMENMNYQSAMYGMDVESFVSAYYGMDYATFEEQMKLAATESAKQAMVCIKIAKEENIVISDEEANSVIEQNYISYGYDSADSFKASVDLEEYKDSLLLNKVVDFLVENAKVSEPASLTE